MFSRISLSGLALSIFLITPAAAQETTCELRGTNEMVTLLLCPSGLDQEELREVGKAACGDRKPCGAWIWDDTQYVPTDVPDSHDKLPGDSIRSALAVWMNELDQLIIIDKIE